MMDSYFFRKMKVFYSHGTHIKEILLLFSHSLSDYLFYILSILLALGKFFLQEWFPIEHWFQLILWRIPQYINQLWDCFIIFFLQSAVKPVNKQWQLKFPHCPYQFPIWYTQLYLSIVCITVCYLITKSMLLSDRIYKIYFSWERKKLTRINRHHFFQLWIYKSVSSCHVFIETSLMHV